MTDQQASSSNNGPLQNGNDARGLRIYLLGGFSIERGPNRLPIETIRLRRARDVLKLLALAPEHRIHREQLMEWLWPERDPNLAAHSLYQTLYTLRKQMTTLDPFSNILFIGDFVELTSKDKVWTDVEAFQQLANDAHQKQGIGSSQEAAVETRLDLTDFQAALDYYQGDLLPEDTYTDLYSDERNNLRRAYLTLLLQTANSLMAQNKINQALEVWQRLVDADPVNEEAHTGLMRAYAVMGERQKAIRQYETMREILLRELEVAPSAESQLLFTHIQKNEFTAKPDIVEPSGGQRHNLPRSVSSFIGREKALAEVQDLVRTHRLVTLFGTGGVGKTRLAIRTAEGLLDYFPQGVFWVELASLDDPNKVLLSLIQVIGFREVRTKPLLEALADYLSQKHVLILMDNVEHLVGACVVIIEGLLKRCPSLHVLVTSRETLVIPGEERYQVPPLSFPGLGALPPTSEVAHYESVRLFVDRAGSASDRFILNDANKATVAYICQRLDGIPLALELAAARQRMMDLDQIVARLDNALDLLTGGSRTTAKRHQTLRALIDWSYNLLPENERQLFRRLAIFAGGWALSAAEEVCFEGEASEVMDLLRGLVDKSLVVFVARDQGGGRYQMLETIRQYAREQLQGGKEMGWLPGRHLDYYARLSQQAESFLRGRDQMVWMDRLDEEIDNLRLALDSSLQRCIDQGLQLASDLMWFWHIRNHLVEGIEWLKRLISADDFETGTGRLATWERRYHRARALRTLSILGYWHGSYLTQDQLIAAGEESVQLFRDLGANARHELAVSLIFQFEPNQRFVTCAQEGLSIFREEKDLFYTSESLYLLANHLFYKGELEQAKIYLDESLAICRELKDYDGVGSRGATMAYIALYQGDYQRSAAASEEGITNVRLVRNLRAEYSLLTLFLKSALAQAKYDEAVVYGEKALSFFKEINENQAVASFLCYLGLAAWSRGDIDRAVSLAQETIALRMDPDYGYNFDADPHFILGRVALSQGETSQAGRHFREILSRIISTGSIIPVCVTLEGWALLMVAGGQPNLAARLFGAIDKWYQRFIHGLTPRERQEHADGVAALQERLGQEEFLKEWKIGQSMTLDQALDSTINPPDIH